MKKNIFILFLLLLIIPTVSGQQPQPSDVTARQTVAIAGQQSLNVSGEGASVVPARQFAVKTNVLYDVTTSLNLGIEVALAPQWTLDISANYNPWKFGNGMRLKHWMIQPEVRYWLREKFAGHFFGLNAQYADYNVGGIRFLSDNMQSHRYQGKLYSVGLSYGYQWHLSSHWSMEATVGLGWLHLDYDKYPCASCGTPLSASKNYFGPTKAALSFIYFIK